MENAYIRLTDTTPEGETIAPGEYKYNAETQTIYVGINQEDEENEAQP